MRRNPFRSFFIALAVLFGIIVLSNIASNLTKKETPKQEVIKDVTVYQISRTPTLELQAKVNASGAVQIFAQTNGIVKMLNATEGQQVSAGTPIVYLTTSYQGGNAAALQSQLASRQYQNVLDTFDQQKDLINKQRDLANTNLQNSEDLTAITKESQEDVQQLLSLQEDSLSQIEQTINTLEQTNDNGINDQLIAQAQEQEAQVLQSVIQLHAQLRSVDYQTDPDKPPVSLPDIQKDIALQQLDIQEKALDLTRDVSAIQAQLAAVQAQLMCPASPFPGTVEKIHVKEGDLVNPGTLIATITGSENTVTATVLVPKSLATIVSQVDASRILIDGNYQSVIPSYVSQSPTDGQLYTVFYNLENVSGNDVANGEYVSIDVPVGLATDKNAMPFVPIDAVYQSTDASYVLVVVNGKAVSKTVKLGNVYGRYVRIISGLTGGDRVILNRNVIAGEKVSVQNAK